MQGGHNREWERRGRREIEEAPDEITRKGHGLVLGLEEEGADIGFHEPGSLGSGHGRVGIRCVGGAPGDMEKAHYVVGICAGCEFLVQVARVVSGEGIVEGGAAEKGQSVVVCVLDLNRMMLSCKNRCGTHLVEIGVGRQAKYRNICKGVFAQRGRVDRWEGRQHLFLRRCDCGTNRP